MNTTSRLRSRRRITLTRRGAEARLPGLVRLSALLVLWGVPALSEAHVVLGNPAPRDGNSGYVTVPCGSTTPATGPITDLTVGQTIDIQFETPIPHPSPAEHFRLSFSPDGLTGFDDPANFVAASIPGVTPDAGVYTYSHLWTVPDRPCDPCAIQVWQIPDNYTDYFSCANIRILQAGVDGGVDGGTDAPAMMPTQSGCACSMARRGAGGWAAWLLLAVAGVAVVRRARRRTTK